MPRRRANSKHPGGWTLPERLLYAELKRQGAGVFGLRAQAKELKGTPDFVLDGPRIAIFADGDLWHGYKLDKLHPGFYRDKIEKNMARDRLVDSLLIASGWVSVRVWEHNIKRPRRLREIVRGILECARSAGAA